MGRFRIAEAGYPYFVTSHIVHWLPVFVQPATCDIITDSLAFCRSTKNLHIHAYVIMPTHVHLIVSAEGDLPTVLRDFKRHTSVELVEHYETIKLPAFHNVFRYCGARSRHPVQNKVWEEGNHPEQVHSREFFQQKADYIHRNPLRKGLVRDPLAWHYSSAAAFAGDADGPLEVDWLEW